MFPIAMLTMMTIVTIVTIWSVLLCASSPPGLSLWLQLSMPTWTSEVYGGCAHYWLHITSPTDDSQLFVDVVCINKTATRLPEVPLMRAQ